MNCPHCHGDISEAMAEVRISEMQIQVKSWKETCSKAYANGFETALSQAAEVARNYFCDAKHCCGEAERIAAAIERLHDETA